MLTASQQESTTISSAAGAALDACFSASIASTLSSFFIHSNFSTFSLCTIVQHLSKKERDVTQHKLETLSSSSEHFIQKSRSFNWLDPPWMGNRKVFFICKQRQSLTVNFFALEYGVQADENHKHSYVGSPKWSSRQLENECTYKECLAMIN